MKNKITFIVLVISVSIMAALLGANRHRSDGHAEASYVTDVSDPRKLIGLADNAFIGTVKSSGKTHYIGSTKIPSTLYSVEIDENIKGKLFGLVTINQDGGVTEDNNKILLNGDELLEAGRQYLFATRKDASGRWNTLIPIYGDLLIDNQDTYVKIKERFVQAEKQQIVFTTEQVKR
jgi:hypothetical protein